MKTIKYRIDANSPWQYLEDSSDITLNILKDFYPNIEIIEVVDGYV